jgi:uncharacterized membrane protein
MDKKSMISQLASVSEGALGKLASSDLSKTALQGALVVKERVEKLMKSMTDLDERVVALEARVAALEGKKVGAPAKRTTTSPAKRTTAAKAPPAPSTAAENPPTAPRTPGEPVS